MIFTKTKQHNIKKLSIAKDFSRFPAGRYPVDGPYNGTTFCQEKLLPLLQDVQQDDDIVEVDFSGVAGLAASFLEEAFGGLIQKANMSKSFLDKHLKIVIGDEDELQDLADLAYLCIEQANDRKNNIAQK